MAQPTITVSRLAAHKAIKLAESNACEVAISRVRGFSIRLSSTRTAPQVITASAKARGCTMASLFSTRAAPNSSEGCHREETTTTGSIHRNTRSSTVVELTAISAM